LRVYIAIVRFDFELSSSSSLFVLLQAAQRIEHPRLCFSASSS
jgi:hypothetical protein